jgi:precorrin-6y C5,15-methyltransferase (decarboxylating) CbiE subunit
MPAKLHIVGVGPGAPEYLPPIAQGIIRQAEVVIGGRRHLEQYARADQQQVVVNADLSPTVDYISRNWHCKRMVVLVSGDPGLYSLMPLVREAIGEENIEVIPGISPLQLAFARFKQGWEETIIISLHGRRPAGLVDRVKNCPKAALLTDSRFPPSRLAAHLLNAGVPNRRAWVAQNLSYEDEVLVETDLVSLAQMSGFDSCVVIIGEVI